MSSKFISSSGAGDLSAVLNGSLDIHGSSLSSVNLIPGQPVKTDTATKKLISSKIALEDLNEPLSQFVADTTSKTMFIQSLSNDGTYFSNNVTADGFILRGATSENKAYLMSDGTTTVNSAVGQPNIYLYTNSNVTPANAPSAGQIRMDNIRNDLTTRLYISESTRDGINIEVFLAQISDISIIYLQDVSSSTNWVRFTVIGTTIYPTYIDINVVYLSSSATGASDFGGSQPIFMSIFDNSFLIANRITTLETKTQLQSATNNITRFANTVIIDNGDPVFALPKFEVSDEIKAYIPLDLGNNDINNAGLYNGCDVNDMKDLLVLNTNAISAKLDKITADGLYAPLSGADYLTTTSASGTYLAKEDASTLYATISALNNYLTTASATNQYLGKNDALALYATTSSLSNYLTSSSATNLYLSKNDATLYATVSALNNYLTTASANGLYAKITDISNFITATAANNAYATITRATALEAKTANIASDGSGTNYTGDNTFILPFGGTKYFTIRDDNTPVSQLLFGVSNTSITTQLQLNMQGKKIALLGTPTSDSDATTKLYVDNLSNTKLNINGTNAMTGDLNMGTKNITNAGTITATQISLTSGASNQFLKGDGSLDVNAYVQQSGIGLFPSGVPYVNPSGQLSAAGYNIYISKGEGTIQSILDSSILDNNYSSVKLSSSTFVENVVLSKTNYTITGLSSFISGSLTLGLLGVPTSGLSIQDIVVLGDLIFITDTNNHRLKHYFSGCEFGGDITFPTLTHSSLFSITFEDCIFSGPAGITFYNILNPITFTRCVFKGQNIINTLSSANKSKLTFRDCKGLATLEILNCTMYGLNESIASGNSFTVDSTSTALLRANGTTDTNTYLTTALASTTYPTMTSGTFVVQWTGGAGGTTSDQTISWRRLSNGTSTTVWLRFPLFSVTIGTANSNFGVLMTVGTVPANLSVAGQPNLPIMANFNGVVQCGWLVHYGNAFGIQPSNKGPAVAGTVCGIPNATMVSYMI